MDYLITNSALVLGGVEDASVLGAFDPAFASHAIRFVLHPDPDRRRARPTSPPTDISAGARD